MPFLDAVQVASSIKAVASTYLDSLNLELGMNVRTVDL